MSKFMISSHKGVNEYDMLKASDELQSAISKYIELAGKSTEGDNILKYDDVEKALYRDGKHSYFKHVAGCDPVAVAIYSAGTKAQACDYYNRALTEDPKTSEHVGKAVNAYELRRKASSQDKKIQVGDFIVMNDRLGRIDVTYDNLIQLDFSQDEGRGYNRKFMMTQAGLLIVNSTMHHVMDMPTAEQVTLIDEYYADFALFAPEHADKIRDNLSDVINFIDIYTPVNVWRLD